MSGVADVLDGVMPPRREVALSPPSTLDNFEIVETSMQRLLLSLNFYIVASSRRFDKCFVVGFAKAINQGAEGMPWGAAMCHKLA